MVSISKFLQYWQFSAISNEYKTTLHCHISVFFLSVAPPLNVSFLLLHPFILSFNKICWASTLCARHWGSIMRKTGPSRNLRGWKGERNRDTRQKNAHRSGGQSSIMKKNTAVRVLWLLHWAGTCNWRRGSISMQGMEKWKGMEELRSLSTSWSVAPHTPPPWREEKA